MKKETRRISEVEEEKKQANRLAIVVDEKHYAEFGLTKAAVKKYILMQIAKAKG